MATDQIFLPQQLTYPFFEPNQMLTNEHLNNIIDYQKKQNSVTRVYLSGMGIICGLNLSALYEENTSIIQVGEGVGMTSNGHIVKIERTALKYCTANKDQLQIAGLSSNDLLVELFADAGSSTDSTQRSTIANAFPEKQHENQVVILYLQEVQDKKNSCINDCDEKGHQQWFSVRFFLVTKATALMVVKAANKITDTAESDVLTKMQYRFQLPKLSIKRFGYKTASGTSGVDISDITTTDLYYSRYREICSASIEEIRKAMNTINPVYGFLLTGHCIRLNTGLDSADLGKKLSLQLNALPLYKIQYFYDYLKDIIAAYNEFRDVIFDLTDACCPDLEKFKYHLLLGIVVEAETCKTSIYRNHFEPSSLIDGNRLRTKEVQFLYTRIQKLLDNFQVPDLFKIESTIAIETKIVPGTKNTHVLAEALIPYYYPKDTLNKIWNFNSWRRCEWNNIASYSIDQDYLSDNIDDASFFRIEGHIGKEISSEIKSLKSKLVSYNLPFEIIALKIGAQIDFTNHLYEVFFEDLENLFLETIGELKFSLQEFSKIKIPSELLTLINSLVTFLDTDLSSFNYEFDILALAIKESQYSISATTSSNLTAYGIELVDLSGKVVAHSVKSYNTKEKAEEATRKFLVKFREAGTNIEIKPVQNTSYPSRMIVDSGEPNIQLQTVQYFLSLEDAKLKIAGYKSIYDKIIEQLGNSTDPDLLSLRSLLNTVSKVLANLKTDFYERAETTYERLLFHQFAKKQPGMEHIAGVSKGGTFILVYTNSSDAEVAKAFDLNLNSPNYSSLAKSIKGDVETADAFTGIIVGDFYLPFPVSLTKSAINFILPKPRPSILLEKLAFCTNDASAYPFELKPAGGHINGPGIVYQNSIPYFKPSATGLAQGEITLYYNVDDMIDSIIVTLLPVPDAGFAALEPTYCIDPKIPNQIPLTPNFAGGVFSGGTAVKTDPQGRWVIDLNDVPANTDFEITYTLALSADTCGNYSKATIKVYHKPDINFTFGEKDINKICKNDPAIALISLGNITNGIFDGEGVDGSNFNPAKVDMPSSDGVPLASKEVKINYSFADSSTGCFNKVEKTITVYNAPDPSFDFTYPGNHKYLCTKGPAGIINTTEGRFILNFKEISIADDDANQDIFIKQENKISFSPAGFENYMAESTELIVQLIRIVKADEVCTVTSLPMDIIIKKSVDVSFTTADGKDFTGPYPNNGEKVKFVVKNHLSGGIVSAKIMKKGKTETVPIKTEDDSQGIFSFIPDNNTQSDITLVFTYENGNLPCYEPVTIKIVINPTQIN